MRTSISTLPSSELPKGGPEFMVAPLQGGATCVDLYRKYAATPFVCHPREPAMAIIRTPVLATPDRVALVSAIWSASVLNVDLNIRRFEGTLFANDPWIGLINVELGSLAIGAYDVFVRSTVLRFRDLTHPEEATGPHFSEQRFHFECH